MYKSTFDCLGCTKINIFNSHSTLYTNYLGCFKMPDHGCRYVCPVTTQCCLQVLIVYTWYSRAITLQRFRLWFAIILATLLLLMKQRFVYFVWSGLVMHEFKVFRKLLVNTRWSKKGGWPKNVYFSSPYSAIEKNEQSSFLDV